MPTPKEWLEKNCPLKSTPGHKCVKANQRGRMSKEHHDILAKNQDKLSGYKAETVENKDGSKRIVNKSSDTPVSKVIADLSFRYNEKNWKAVEVDSGRERGMREACNICRYSLIGCFCDRPRIVAAGDRTATTVEVKVIPR